MSRDFCCFFQGCVLFGATLFVGAASSTPRGHMECAPTFLFIMYAIMFSLDLERIHLCFTINTSRWHRASTGAGAAVGADRGVQLQHTGYAAGFQPHHAAGADRVRSAASGRENYPAGPGTRPAGRRYLSPLFWSTRRFRRGMAAICGSFWPHLSGWGPRMWIGRPPCASISSRRWPGWCWCKRYTLPRR